MSLILTIAGVTITGNSHKVERESFSFVNAIGQRDTLSFAVCSGDQSYKPAPGAAVVLTDSVLGVQFAGNARQPSASLRGNDLVSTVGCASWEQRFDERKTGQQHFRDEFAGDIFSYLITNTMNGDGITASVALAGPKITLDLDFATVREAFDKICELASDSTNTYMWDCLPDKTARFYRQNSYPAPFNCTATNHDIRRPITVSWSLDDYANRVFVRMGMYVRENLSDSFVGDGTTKSWSVEFPIAAEPTITVGGVVKTVGVMDSDTGKDWYYRINSPDIVQDAGAAAVGVGVAIVVDPYKGYESIVLPALQDDGEVDARAAAEGGTGYYEAIISIDTPGGTTDATAAAQAYLDRHAKIPVSVEYMTSAGGLKAGQYQTITLPIFGINASYFIQSVTLEFQGKDPIWRVRAVAGALVPDYIARLRVLSGGGTNATGIPGQGTGEGPAGPPGGAPPPSNPTGLTGSETPAARTVDLITRQTIAHPTATVTFATAVANRWVNLEISKDGGTTWEYRGVYAAAASGATFIALDELAPGVNESWRFRGYAGSPDGNNSPASGTVSATFSVIGLAVPSAGGVTSASVGAAVNITDADISHQYVQIPPVTYTDPSSDVNAFFVRVTVQCVNASGTPAPGVSAGAGDQGGDEVPFAGTQVTGDTHVTDPLIFDYNPAGSAFTYLRYRIYSLNRKSSDPYDFQDASMATLQTCWSGGANHFDVNFGSLPVGALDLRRTNPASLGRMLLRDAVTGKIKLATSNLANMAVNPYFADGLVGWTTTPGCSTAAGYGLQAGDPGLQIPTNGGSDAYAFETEMHDCQPGEAFFASAYLVGYVTSNGLAFVMIRWFNAVGTFIGQSLGNTVSPTGSFLVSKITATAPANALKAQLWVYVGSTYTTGPWFCANVLLTRQLPTGPGTQPDDFGGVKAKLATLGGLAFNGSGEQQANLGYTMQLNGSGQIVLGNLAAVLSLPALPNASYPQGAVVLQTSDNKIYRNTTGSAWVKSSDPADLVAGAVATGVTIAAAQVTAGTLISGVSYTGVLTAGQVISGTFTGLSLVLNLNGITTSITNQFAGVGGLGYVGLKCLNNSTNQYSTLGSEGFYSTYPGGGSVNINGISGGALANFIYPNASAQISAQNLLAAMTLAYTGAGAANLQQLVASNQATLLIQSAAGTIQLESSAGSGTRIIPSNLPNTAVAGSKQLYYDPLDGNRVKYAV